jgi:four helix bundle protein
MRGFKKYTIWQNGIKLVKNIYSFSKNLPDNEKFGLVSQIKRVSVSIPSNIAEGCGRNSVVEFKRFLEIALGSAFELETQLIIIQDLDGGDYNDTNILLSDITVLQKSINSLIQKIKNS